MIKKCLFAAALLSLALAGGCAKGGNGVVPPPPSIDVTITSPQDTNSGAIYPTQILTLQAKVSNANTTAVTWSLSGGGTLTPVTPPTTPATATYVAPATAGSATITATLVADSTVKGTLTLTIVDVTTDVAPFALSVGKGLTQQFTAVAVPEAAPQTFTWTCTAGGSNSCASFTSNSSGLASYTANDICTGSCVQISALSTLDPNGCSNPKNCTIAKFPLVASRVTGTYAFRFSGYDSSRHPVMVAGSFTADKNGANISGFEDVVTSGGLAKPAITGGSYTPISFSDPNSNNAGALTLPTGAFPNTFRVVLDGAGDIEMIESDPNDPKGTGSGTAQKSSNPAVFTGQQTFAFGFTGADSNGNRVGYAGLLPTNGTPAGGQVAGGLIDANDNGQSSNSVCGAPPCTVTGSYTQNSNGSWHLTLTSPAIMNFDFFLASGGTGKGDPLTFYAISTDPVATHPAVSGTMVLQDSSLTYDITHFKGTSVSALTGVNAGNANVSLTLGSTDGNGNFSGQFDQNNAGAIVSDAQFPPTGSTSYTYAATGTPPAGRYIFQMLGDPTVTPVKAPIPFVLYASGANRGFLLDQASPSVMTGTMNPRGNGSGSFGGSELPGTYAAATTSSGGSAVIPIAANLLLTFPGNVSGTQYPGSQTVTGMYDLGVKNFQNGTGKITLTAPAQTYVIYVLDSAGPCNPNISPVCAIQSFLMMDVDNTNPIASIIFAQQ